MDNKRNKEILQAGYEVAYKKMNMPQNKIKPDYLEGGDRPHITPVLDYLVTRLYEEFQELGYATSDRSEERVDWYALWLECGDVIAFASMLAEYCKSKGIMEVIKR